MALNPEVLDSLKEDLGQVPAQRLPADTVAALKEDLSPPSMLRPPTGGIYSPVMGPGGKRVLLPSWTAFMDKPAEWTPAQKAAVAEEPQGVLEKVIPYLGKAPMEPSVMGKAFDILSTPAYFPVKAALKEAIAPEAKLGRRPSVEDIVETRVGEVPWVTKPLSTIADLLLINATFPMLGGASRLGQAVKVAKGMKAAEITQQAAATLKGLKTKPTKGLWEAFLKRREVKQAKQGLKVIAPTLRRLGEAGKPTELGKTLAEQARAGQRYAGGFELPYPLRGLVRPEWQDIGIKAPWAFTGGEKAAALFRGSRIGKVLDDILGGQLRSAASSFPDQEALVRTSEYLTRGNKQLAMMELERVAKSERLSQEDKKRVFDWIEDIKKSEPPTPPPSGEIPPEFGMGGEPVPPTPSAPVPAPGEDFLQWLGVKEPAPAQAPTLPFLAAPTTQPTTPTIPFGPMIRQQQIDKNVAEQRAFTEAQQALAKGAKEPLGEDVVTALKEDLLPTVPLPLRQAAKVPQPVFGEPLTEAGIPKYQRGLFGQTEIGTGAKPRPTPEGQLEIGTAPSTEGIAPELVRAPISEEKPLLPVEQLEIGKPIEAITTPEVKQAAQEAAKVETVVKTTKPKLTELNPDEFATDVRLQPREALSELDIQRMTANFNYAEFDPVLAFVPPEGGKPLVIAGHHRLEAALRKGIKVDTRLYPQGTLSWEDAVSLANKSNLNRRLLQPVETARVIDSEVKAGKSYKQISSELLGWKETTIKEMHSLVDLTPSIQRIVNEGQFPVEKILALAKRIKKYGIQPELQEDFFYNVLMKQDLPVANVEAMLDGLMPEAVKLKQTELGFTIPTGIYAQANAIASKIAKLKPTISWLKKTTTKPELRAQAEALGIRLPEAEAMLADYQGQLDALAKSIGRGVQAPVTEAVRTIRFTVKKFGEEVPGSVEILKTGDEYEVVRTISSSSRAPQGFDMPFQQTQVRTKNLGEAWFKAESAFRELNDVTKTADVFAPGMEKQAIGVVKREAAEAAASARVKAVEGGEITAAEAAAIEAEEIAAPLPIATARKAGIHIPQKVNKTAAQVVKLSGEGNIAEAERLFAEIPETAVQSKQAAQEALMVAKQAVWTQEKFPLGTDVVAPAGEAKVVGVNRKTGWVKTQVPGEESIREFEPQRVALKPEPVLPKAPAKVRIPSTGRTHKTVGDVLYPDQDKAITASLINAEVDGLADIAKTKGAYVRYQGHYYNNSRALLEEQRKWNEHLAAVTQQFATTPGKGGKAKIGAFKTEAEAMQTQLTAKWQSLIEEYSVNQGRRPQPNGWMMLPGWGRPEPPDNPEMVKRAIEWVIGERTAYTEAEQAAGLLKEGQLREGYMPRYLSPRGLQNMSKWLGKKPPRGAGDIAKFQHWMDRYMTRDPELSTMKTSEVNQLAREGKLSITGLNKGKPIKIDYDLFLIEPHRVTTARKLQSVNLVGWAEYEQKALDLSVKGNYGRKFYSDQTDEIKAFMRELTDLPEPLKGHPKTLYIPKRSAEQLFGETVAERLASLSEGGFVGEGESAMLTAEEAERILMGLKGTGKVTQKVPVYVIPQGVADIMRRTYSAVSTDKGLNWLVGSYDSALRFWVRQTLGPFMEWWMRNGVGNMWNMGILAGNTNPMNYYDAAQSERAILTGSLDDFTRVVVNQRGETMPLGKLVVEAIRYDLYNTGFYGAEAQRANVLKPETYGFWAGLGETPLRRGVGLAGKAIDLPPRVGFWLNQRLENNSRLALFIDRWRKGDDFVEAANYVRKFGFDYRDLTPAEQQVRRWIYPFWSWYAKNIPLQMEQAIKRPGLFMMKETLKDDIEQGERVLPPELIPQFIRDSYHLQVRAGRTGYESLVLDNWIPFADIYRLDKRMLLGALGPLPKNIMEQSLNVSLLTGRKLEEHPGQTVPFLGRYMRGRKAQFFRNVRYLSVLDRLTRSDYTAREKIQRFIFGLKPYPIDPIAELKARKYERAQEIGALNKDIGMKKRALARYVLQKDSNMEKKTGAEIAALELKKAQVQTRPFPQLPISTVGGER